MKIEATHIDVVDFIKTRPIHNIKVDILWKVRTDGYRFLDRYLICQNRHILL